MWYYPIVRKPDLPFMKKNLSNQNLILNAAKTTKPKTLFGQVNGIILFAVAYVPYFYIRYLGSSTSST